jgi:tellurite resistance protein TerA
MNAVLLSKGANTTLPSGPLQIRVAWSGLSPRIEDVDVSAFLLRVNGKTEGDGGMIFYGQTASRDGAIEIEALSKNGETRLRAEPARLNGGVVRIAVTATPTSSEPRAFSDVGQIGIQIDGPDGVVAEFPVETRGASEAALILGELYEHRGAWKFRAIGQGFNGGLKPLAEHFGVVLADVAPAPASRSEPTPAKPINLSKVSLSKANPTISLAKKADGLGEIRVNLNWNEGRKNRGFFGRRGAPAIDLDLCCLYELADGTRLGVQALGRHFGSYHSMPFIELSGDDRTGAVQDGEWLRINGQEWSKTKRILIWAMIYEGVPNWSATDGVVTLYAPGNPDVEVRLEGTANERLCAIALLENMAGDLRITRENRYFPSARDIDRHYRFDLSWVAGSK